MSKIIPQYEPLIGTRERKAMTDYMANPGFLTEYKKTEEFENKIAEYLKIKHCIVVNNGTISLSLALLALGIKPGDRVIVPNLTMIATPNAVKLIGAEPIFVDVTKLQLLDCALADKLISTYKAKAIILVSINGRSWGPEAWEYIWKWKEAGIKIVEDAAQSFGSKNYEGYFCGTRVGQIGSFSFSMPKIITTGQGGCLVTNDDSLADTLRKLKDFGRNGGGNDTHSCFGINSKFTEMQAVIGLTQLEGIEFRVRRKKEIFNLYKEQLNKVPNIQFLATNLSVVTPWFVDIFVAEPLKLGAFLKTKNIRTRPIYPPINTQEAYKSINNWPFPVTKKLSSRGIWLPSSLTLKDEDIIYICNCIKEFYVPTR